MRKIKGKIFLPAIIAISCVILLSACGNSPTKTESRVYDVEPGEKQQIKIELQQDERLDITIDVEIAEEGNAITQGDENIGIRIVSPEGYDIVSEMRIGFGEFMVLAEEAGDYIITFDNHYSPSTHKRIMVMLKYS
jgi:hypothetical protein